MIRVMLVDDQELVRAGLRIILESEPGIEVVGEAGTGAAAIELARELDPDVIAMDIQMPGMDGLAATRVLVDDPSVSGAVLMLTTFDRDDYLFEALRAGASGFLLKTASPEQLVEAVTTIAAGDALLAPSVTARVIAAFASQPAHPAPSASSAAQDAELTEREREVLTLVARGHSNAEIANALFLGEATVKTHVSKILMKLGVRDRVQAVVWAYEHGIVSPASSAD